MASRCRQILLNKTPPERRVTSCNYLPPHETTEVVTTTRACIVLAHLPSRQITPPTSLAASLTPPGQQRQRQCLRGSDPCQAEEEDVGPSAPSPPSFNAAPLSRTQHRQDAVRRRQSRPVVAPPYPGHTGQAQDGIGLGALHLATGRSYPRPPHRAPSRW